MITKQNKISTPSFVIRKSKLQKQVDDLKRALTIFFSKSIAGYSFKTNNLPWIISFMKDNGLWAEVVSSDEYLLAKSLNFPINNIIFNGPVKGRDEFIDAIENGAIVNIDSKRELQWLKDCNPETKKSWKIGLRVNFCIEDKCPGETQGGSEDGRFGFSIENGEFSEALNYLIENEILLSGIHLHCSSKTRSLNIYKTIATEAVNIIQLFGLELDYVDIGGGFFGGVPNKPTFDNYFNTVKSILKKAVDIENTTLIVEPGISLVGSSIDYVTKVVDIKSTKNNRFVLLDGSRIHVDPLMRKSSYTFHVVHNQAVSNRTMDQILCGFTCMENDRFFHYQEEELQVGDLVIFEKVGAYTMGLSPQFIAAYPIVFVDENNNLIIVREKKELPNV